MIFAFQNVTRLSSADAVLSPLRSSILAMAFYPCSYPAVPASGFSNPFDEEHYISDISDLLTWPMSARSLPYQNPDFLSPPDYHGSQFGLSDPQILPTFNSTSPTGSNPGSQLPSPPESTAPSPFDAEPACPAASSAFPQQSPLPSVTKRQRFTEPGPRRGPKVSIDLTFSDDESTIRRKKNTAAARRYREKKLDREKQLENALQEALACNAELKTDVAVLKERVEGGKEIHLALETARTDGERLRMEVEKWKMRAEFWRGQSTSAGYEMGEWD